jgi:glucose-6-phosphate 1-dehydrogenase
MSGTPIVSERQSVEMPGSRPQSVDPCTMVICGALGDLSRRKLLPAIYELMKDHLTHPDFAVIGIGRDETQTDDTFRAQMKQALQQSDEVKASTKPSGRSCARASISSPPT